MFSSCVVALCWWAASGVAIQTQSEELPSQNVEKNIVIEQNGVIHTGGSIASKSSLVRRDSSQELSEMEESKALSVDDVLQPGEETRKGWCNPWSLGGSFHYTGDGTGIVHFPQNWGGVSLTKDQCWEKCRADPACEQAVFKSGGECSLGTDVLGDDPGAVGFVGTHQISHLDVDAYTCFAKKGFGATPPFVGKVVNGPCKMLEGYLDYNAPVQKRAVCDPADQSVHDDSHCSHWPPKFELTAKGCFAKCIAHENCQIARYRTTHSSSGPSYDCWIGTSPGFFSSAADTSKECPGGGCEDVCFTK